MSEAVTVPRLMTSMTMTSMVSEESLARDKHTHTLTQLFFGGLDGKKALELILYTLNKEKNDLT